jgi:hypothetical protein
MAFAIRGSESLPWEELAFKPLVSLGMGKGFPMPKETMPALANAMLGNPAEGRKRASAGVLIE